MVEDELDQQLPVCIVPRRQQGMADVQQQRGVL